MIRFLFIFILCLQTSFKLHAQTNYVLSAYYENWSQYRPGVGGRPPFLPNLIDPTLLTDLYYAFGIFGFVTSSIDPQNPHLTGDFSVQPVEWNDQDVLYSQISALKSLNPQLRVHLSIGGWSFNDPTDPIGKYTYQLFSLMVSSPENRQQFIDSAIAYAHQYQFDGIDIDWEYPGDSSRGGTPQDFNNFLEFLKEAYTAFHAANPPLSLSYTSPALVPAGVPYSYQSNPNSYFQWLASCSEYLDHFNIMTYDYHGAFDIPQFTGVNAPLNKDTNPSSPLFIVKTLQNYLINGVPANKIVLGMPTYGRTFGGVLDLSDSNFTPGKPFLTPGDPGPSTRSPGMLAYFEIADMVAQNQLNWGTDSTTGTAVAYNTSSKQWVSFDTPDTIALKAQFAKETQLLGVMFWAVDMDEYYWGDKYPNIRSALQVLSDDNL